MTSSSSIVFGRTEKEDFSLWNNSVMFIVSGVLLAITTIYMRQFDWLSTSLYFDTQNFNLVGSGTKYIMDVQVSEESFWMNLTIYLSSIVFYYYAYLSGPIFKTSWAIFWAGGLSKNWEKRLDWINWKTFFLFFSATVLALADSQLDFLWKTSTGTTSVFQAFLVSYVFYGVLSEYAIGISLKVCTTSFGRVLGAIGFWDMFWLGKWAYDNGLAEKYDKAAYQSAGKKRKAKTSKAATNKSQPRREPPPSRSSNPSRTPTQSYNHGNRGRGQPTNDLPTFLQPPIQPQPTRMQQASMQQAMSIIDGGSDTEF